MSTVPPAAVVALLPLLDELLEQPAAPRAATAAIAAIAHVLAFKLNVPLAIYFPACRRAQLAISRRAIIRRDHNQTRAAIWQPERMVQRVPGAKARARTLPVAVMCYFILRTAVQPPAVVLGIL